MAREEDPDGALRALDQAAEERGAAALPQFVPAIEQLRAAGDARRLAHALVSHARALALAERLDEAESAASEALAAFRESGSALGQALALNAQGIVALRRGDPSRALEVTGQAAAFAREAADPIVQVRIANVLGAVLIDMGRLPEAAQILEEGLRAARGFPQEAVLPRLRSNLSLALARWALREHDEHLPEAEWRPRAERAIEVLQPALAHWRAQGQHGQVSSSLDNLAIAHIVLGRLAEAHQALDEAEATMDDGERQHSTVFFSCVRARAHLQAGEPALALASLERGHTAADSRGGHVYIDELYRLKSLAHEARGEFEAALQAHKRFHEQRTRLVLERAEQQASALAVTLRTEHALRQVSEERDRAERAHVEARHDPLTGLANRRRFDEYLAGVLPRAHPDHPVSLVLVDIDHFKDINDRHGHLVGDAALCWVAAHLQAQCRQTDLPARLGGDEFALVLAVPLPVALQVCTRLRIAVAAAAPHLPADLRIRLSAGAAETTAPCDRHHLFTRSDEALYAAKAAGRDAVRPHHDKESDA